MLFYYHDMHESFRYIGQKGPILYFAMGIVGRQMIQEAQCCITINCTPKSHKRKSLGNKLQLR